MTAKPTLNFQESSGFLRVDYVEQNPTLQAGLETFSAIADECRARGANKVLVVGVLTGENIDDLDDEISVGAGRGHL